MDDGIDGAEAIEGIAVEPPTLQVYGHVTVGAGGRRADEAGNVHAVGSGGVAECLAEEA